MTVFDLAYVYSHTTTWGKHPRLTGVNALAFQNAELPKVLFSTTPRFYVKWMKYSEILAPIGPMEPHLSSTVEI